MKISTIVFMIATLFIFWKRFAPPMVNTTSLNFADATIIDVRTPDEFASGHVNGAINLPIQTIQESDVTKLTSKDKPVVVYCRSGNRSSMAAGKLKQWGFEQIYDLKTQSGVENAIKSH